MKAPMKKGAATKPMPKLVAGGMKKIAKAIKPFAFSGIMGGGKKP